jgi:hypothetical protein
VSLLVLDLERLHGPKPAPCSLEHRDELLAVDQLDGRNAVAGGIVSEPYVLALRHHLGDDRLDELGRRSLGPMKLGFEVVAEL